jgi:hypothetical protein
MPKWTTIWSDAVFPRAAERGDPGRDNAGVEAGDAVFEPLRNSPGAADVATVEYR